MGNVSTKLQVVATNGSNKTVNRAFSYVNPETDDADLKTFATAFNGLSDNTFNTVYRIDRENITDVSTDTAPTSIFNLTTETCSIEASISTDNGVLTITSPWFYGNNADIFPYALYTEIVNQQIPSGSNSIDARYSYVSRFYNYGKPITTAAYALGVLTDENILSEQNLFHNNTFYFTTGSTIQNSSSKFVIGTEGQTITVNVNSLFALIKSDTLTMSSFIDLLNQALSSQLSSNTAFVSAPQFVHNGTAGTLTFIPNFATTKKFVALSFLPSSATLVTAMVNLIGSSLFSPYYSTSNSAWNIKVSNPNYSAE